MLVIDFGGQYSQLIARRVRECGVFSELLPGRRRRRGGRAPRAEGPDPLRRAGVGLRRRRAARSTARCSSSGIPVLGICYGMQLLAHALGGRVERRRGRRVRPLRADRPRRRAGCSPDCRREQTCWMSHRDTVFAARPPASPSSPPRPPRRSPRSRTPARGIYGDPVPPRGRPHAVRPADPDDLPRGHLRLRRHAGAPRRSSRSRSRGSARRSATAGRSAGCPAASTRRVAALLVHRAIGDQLTCVFVDHGLMRKGEGEQVIAAFRDTFKVPLVAVDAEDALPRAARRRQRPRGQAQA